MKLLLFLSLKKLKNGWNNFSNTFAKFLPLVKVLSKYVIPKGEFVWKLQTSLSDLEKI